MVLDTYQFDAADTVYFCCQRSCLCSPATETIFEESEYSLAQTRQTG